MDNLEQIPPLELVFCVAELGGWDNVVVLTHIHNAGGKIEWRPVNEFQQRSYTNCPSLGWRVYGVRRREPTQFELRTRQLMTY